MRFQLNKVSGKSSGFFHCVTAHIDLVLKRKDIESRFCSTRNFYVNLLIFLPLQQWRWDQVWPCEAYDGFSLIIASSFHSSFHSCHLVTYLGERYNRYPQNVGLGGEHVPSKNSYMEQWLSKQLLLDHRGRNALASSWTIMLSLVSSIFGVVFDDASLFPCFVLSNHGFSIVLSLKIWN